MQHNVSCLMGTDCLQVHALVVQSRKCAEWEMWTGNAIVFSKSCVRLANKSAHSFILNSMVCIFIYVLLQCGIMYLILGLC